MSVTPATIKDVARAAGVSVATDSHALNGAENVLPHTRQRIVEIARELRYAPSGAARSLITRKTDTVGALLPDLHGEFFSELIRGIDQAARARGLHLLLSSSHGDATEAAAAGRLDVQPALGRQGEARARGQPAIIDHPVGHGGVVVGELLVELRRELLGHHDLRREAAERVRGQRARAAQGRAQGARVAAVRKPAVVAAPAAPASAAR